MCWTALHHVWNLSLSVVEMIEDGKEQFTHACYMEVVILASWAIWIHRNNLIFNNVHISFGKWKHDFRDLFLLCIHRAKSDLVEDMTSWLSSL
jgi:hypothetical protein